MAVNADAADDDLLKAKLRPRIKVGVGFGETRSFGKVWKLAADGVTLRADGKIEIGRKFQRVVGDVCEGRMKQKNQYSDKVTVARIKSLTSLVWQWCGNPTGFHVFVITFTYTNEPLAKWPMDALLIRGVRRKAEGAGGHFWHDEVLTPTTITPAKWILLDAT